MDNYASQQDCASGGPPDPLCYLHIEHAAQGPTQATPYPHVSGLEEAGQRGFMTNFTNWQPTRTGVQNDFTHPLATDSAFLKEAGLFQRHGGEPYPIHDHLLGMSDDFGADARQIHLRPNRPCLCHQCTAIRNGCVCMMCCRRYMSASERPLQAADEQREQRVGTDSVMIQWSINIIAKVLELLLPTHVSNVMHM